MTPLTCGECLETFHGKSQLDLHRQAQHQMSVKVKFFDSSIKNIDRDTVNGGFVCPFCQNRLKTPKSMQRHGLRDCRRKPSTKKQSILVHAVADTSTPPFLRQIGLTVNLQAKVLICNSCHYCVGPQPERVHSHLTRLHSLGNSDIHKLRVVLESLDLMSEKEIALYGMDSIGGVEPVKGLPVFDGEMCTTCSYVCCSKRVMQRHLKSHHSAPIRNVKLQTLFISSRRRYFRVIVATDENFDLTGRDDFQSELDKFRNFQNESRSEDVDERIIPPLLKQLHWHKKLPKYTRVSCEELMSMCRIPMDCEINQNLYAAVSQFFKRGLNLLDKVPYLTRRYVIAGKLDVSNDHRGFGYVEDESGTYQRHMAKMIRMVAVCYEKKQQKTPVWCFTTSNDAEKAASCLLHLCDLDAFDASSEQVQSQVLAVLKALYVVESDNSNTKPRDDFELYSVYRYLVCSSITGGELDRLKMLEVNNITGICAALVYWARLFILVSIAPKDMSTIARNLHYIQDGVPTCFNSLVEVMKLGKCLSGPTEGMGPIVHWLDDDMNSLVCKTAEVTKAKLQKMASSLSVGIKDTLQHTILRGFSVDHLRAELESAPLVDDINTKSDGSWFMSKPENALSTGPQHLLDFLGSGRCKDSLWSLAESSHWDVNRVRKWLLDCDEFMDDMTIFIHLTFGQPARASEMSSFRLRDSNMEFRSVYSIRKRFSMIQVYHKSMNVTGKFKPIARFAPACLNTELVLYFYLVRPVQAFLFDVLYRDHNRVYLDSVFVKFGKVMNAEQIRRSIAKGFSKFSEMKLDVSTYRHVATAFIDPHFRDQRFDDDDLLDEQAGHSRQTASTVYARGDNDPSTLSRDQLYKFWVGSHRWHQFLGLASADKPVVQRSCTHVEPTAELVSRHDETEISNQFAQISSNLKSLGSQIKALDATKPARMAAQKFPSVSAEAFALAKQVVDRFTGRTTGTFRSAEQGIALALLISKPNQHRLVLLPTGGGKSILYMAHFIANPNSVMTSIVLIPNVALLNESIVKAKLQNIGSCKYSSDLRRSEKLFNLVFAAVEHVSQEDFREYVTLLQARGRLHSIFIDEAHLIMTAQSYRPQMQCVSMLAMFRAPIVLLSATVPIPMEKDLERFFRVEFETIRSRTNRENISYRVKEVADLKSTAIAEMQSHQVKFNGSRNRCIVYCNTRSEVDDVSQLYRSKTNFTVSSYHAGMDQQEQAKSVAQWKSGKCIWMVATNAFGVGIDYPSVRLVLHVGGSGSLLDYGQETGRAGRDGFPALGLILTNRQYQDRTSKLVNAHTRSDYCAMVAYMNEVNSCRRQQLQVYLDGCGVPCLADSSNSLCDVCNDSRRLEVAAEDFHDDRGNIDVFAQSANRQNASDRIIQGAICEFLNQLPSVSCPICWVRGRLSQSTRPCFCFRNCCYKCQYSDHASSSCPNKVEFFPGTCYFCGLPSIDIAGVGNIMHPRNTDLKCSPPAKTFVIESVWASFHTKSPQGAPTDPKLFSQWLPQRAERSAFSNLVITFYQLIKTHGSFPLERPRSS